MLSFNEFTEELITGCKCVIGEIPGPAIRVEKGTVNKPQKGELTGLRFIKEGCRVAPTLYAEDLYARYVHGHQVNMIAHEAVESIRKSFDIALPFSDEEFDLNAMRGDIRPRLLSKERNTAIAGTVPYMDAGEGLMLIADVVRGDFRAIITKEMLKESGISEDELFETALGNVPEDEAVLFGLSDVVYTPPGERLELLGSGADRALAASFDVFLLSNKEMFWGAAALFYPGVMDKLRGMLGDFYVIPSSVHELLLTSVSEDVDPDKLSEMIWSANRSVVDEEEVLSDDLYICESGTLKLVPWRECFFS